MIDTIDVLVIGAGPTGLTAATEAMRHGLTVRIIDRKQHRATHDSRALVVHSRVMELLHAMNDGRVCEGIKESGFTFENLNIYLHGSRKPPRKVPVERGARWGDTAYPFSVWLPQYKTEVMIQDELERLGGEVEWDTTLESVVQNGKTVETTVTRSDGTVECIVSRYAIGCDGGRSQTREILGIEMHREKSKLYLIVAEVNLGKESSPFGESLEPQLFLHNEGLTIFFSLGEPFRYRVISLAPEGVTNENNVTLDKRFFDEHLAVRTGFDINCTVGEWATVFEVTHGTASRYQEGRVFLAGDASHVHSPLGGQGMNYGISDVMNLIWKLAWSERCCKKAGEGSLLAVKPILESYNAERAELGKGLVSAVAPATYFMASRNILVAKLRNVMAQFAAPVIIPRNMRVLGQLDLRYSSCCSPIICDSLSSTWENFLCEPGDRLPNLRLVEGDRLYDKVDRLRHTWVILDPSVHSIASTLTSNPGTIKAVHVIAASVQDAPPNISLKTLRTSQAILVRPDLFVAGIGNNIKDVWENMCKLLDEEALISM